MFQATFLRAVLLAEGRDNHHWNRSRRAVALSASIFDGASMCAENVWVATLCDDASGSCSAKTWLCSMLTCSERCASVIFGFSVSDLAISNEFVSSVLFVAHLALAGKSPSKSLYIATVIGIELMLL